MGTDAIYRWPVRPATFSIGRAAPHSGRSLVREAAPGDWEQAAAEALQTLQNELPALIDDHLLNYCMLEVVHPEEPAGERVAGHNLA